jgi:hypothetical protein
MAGTQERISNINRDLEAAVFDARWEAGDCHREGDPIGLDWWTQYANRIENLRWDLRDAPRPGSR